MPVRLSVNINKFATLRNARGGNNPNILEAAMQAELFGAEGITVHPRPDGRHIRYEDVRALKPIIKSEFNIEGFPDDSFIALIHEIKPDQVTLVPDGPDVLTSNQGWDTQRQASFLKMVIPQLKKVAGRVSLFVDPQSEMVEGAKNCGADRIELYTGPYAHGFISDRHQSVMDYIIAAQCADSLGLKVNAGHDLDLHNLNFFVSQVKPLHEVSIGHALICDALYLGLRQTISQYLDALRVSS